MKKIVLLLFLGVTGYAQSPNCPVDTSYADIAFNMLKNLDKTQVPTGVLYEYVYPWAEVDFYNGSSTTDTTNTSHFLQSWSELYLSTFNNTGLTHITTVEDAVETHHPDKKFYHPISIIDYNFNTIHPDAVTNNLLSISNQQLFDVPSRPQSPYVANKASMAATLLAEEYPCLYPGTHYFQFRDDLILTNTGFTLSQVTHLQAIFNGNTIYNAPVGGLTNFTLPLTVANEDRSSTLILILTSNGQTTHFIISTCQIAVAPPTNCRGQDAIEITGYPFDGNYGEGSYSEKGVANIYYSNLSCPTKQLRKPIIFVDGFDPSNKQQYQKIWEEYLNVGFEENGIPNVRLGDSLLANGYDIIILDQLKGDKKYNRGGAGLIENNGLVLAELLETLYAQHSATMEEDFVVVGASMGGLVSRYGLAWMEANNKPHHTGLFISFDSPQNGAHIPIGLQQIVDAFTQYGGLRTIPTLANGLHQSNAAKQMLLHHSSTRSESVAAHPFRAIFMNNLASVGNYPSQLRMVSISNGNRVGTLKNLSPNPVDIPAINEKDLEADLGVKRRLLLACNANICFKLRAKTYAQTSSNRFKTSELRLNSLNPLLYLVLGGGAFYTYTEYAVAENGTSYDVAPGSRLRQNPFEIVNDLSKQVIAILLAGPIVVSTNNLSYSNFIPTTSSVAYTFPNNEPFSVYKNFSGVNLTKCAGTTPFDTVYAPTYDLPHVAIDGFIAAAFRNEVYNLKTKSFCPGDCPDYVTLTSPPTTTNYKAAKAIMLNPDFSVNQGTVFKAEIGCNNTSSVNKNVKPLPVSLLSICPLDFDQPKNQINCFPTYTKFTVFVKNLPTADYAEFSTDGGVKWLRANFGDTGYSINLPNNPGQVQAFNVRPHTNPSNSIYGFLQYCP